jgi:hypothetical protein
MGASQEQVLKFVEAGLAGVYKGTLTPQQGSAIASLAGAWVRLHEHGELEALARSAGASRPVAQRVARMSRYAARLRELEREARTARAARVSCGLMGA